LQSSKLNEDSCSFCAYPIKHDIKIIRRISLKTLTSLTLILLLTTIQAAFATQERDDPQNPGDIRERRPAEDVRERRPAEDMRERRPAEDMRERRPAEDMRERRPAEDTRERRDSSNQRSTDRPWRETLAKCREMKQAGKLPKAMKEECKAARELRKKSKQ
jgi:hypothetical protein